jgi:uncharacterized membrane protein
MKLQKKNVIFQMVLCALFIALVYVGTYISIPFGVSKVHLGNLICIIASLFCGEFIGGIAGSIGMGLNDLISGYGVDTILRTLIVKFILGYLVGFIFHRLILKKGNKRFLLLLIGGLFIVICLILLGLYFEYGREIILGNRTFVNSLLLIILCGCIGLIFIGFYLFAKKIKLIEQYVLISCACGTILNVILEFALKIPAKMIFLGMDFNASLIYALTSLPSALITSIITIILGTFFYYPLYLSTKRIPYFAFWNEKIDNLDQ